MKIKTQYKKYVELKQQISALEDEMKEIGEVIKNDILENNGETVDTRLGSFFLVRKKKWQYTGAVSFLEEDIKKRKKEEEQDGTATVLETSVSLTFRAKKL